MTNNEKQKLYRERNPEKVRARKIVFSNLRGGHVKRLPCKECGNEKSEAAHSDYSKPLKVTWLCKEHHTIYDFPNSQTAIGKKASKRLHAKRWRESHREEIRIYNREWKRRNRLKLKVAGEN